MLHSVRRPRACPAWAVLLAGLGLGLFSGARTTAQDREPPPLRLGGVMPGGMRNSATESWGTFDFDLTNLSDSDRRARVVLLYKGREQVQYGRDVWTPARSTLSTWMLAGPAAGEDRPMSCEIQVLLYDLSDGTERVILPHGDERVLNLSVSYRRREPYTVLLLDEDESEDRAFGELPQPLSGAEEAITLARTFRGASTLSEFVHVVRPGPLPSRPEAFDGIDHFIIASNRLAQDPVGAWALRRWLEGGGKVWVMLDRVDAEVVVPLLGVPLDFQVVDRIGLTDFKVETPSAGRGGADQPAQQHDRPVAFARVLLPPEERATHTVNGWPVWFTRPVGRGKVVFTTLGPRALVRARGRADGPSRFAAYPSLPFSTAALEAVADQLRPPDPEPFSVEAFRPLLAEEIGYSVVGRGAVAAVFGVALLAALALGVALRKSHRRELLAGVGPAAALAAAAVVFVLGVSARRATPSTVAVAQIIDAVPGKSEVPVRGLLALYRPDSGPAEVGSERGGLVELDPTEAEGPTRRLTMTDADAWHWDGLSLPAGVRFAAFQSTIPTEAPITAVAHFGPDGVEGKLDASPFQELSDALLTTPNGRNLAVRLGPDGAFRAGGEDVLPEGQFLAGAVLSDRQQRRQDLYRDYLRPPPLGRPDGPDVLLVWAKPIDMHFQFGPQGRAMGDALLAVPLRLERPAPGVRVTVPAPLIPCRRIVNGGSTRPVLDSIRAADIDLRFQLPRAVLPFKVEHARLTAKINAPSRRVVIAAPTDAGPVELRRVDSPLDPIRVDIADERLLRLDAEGGLRLNLSLGDPPQGDGAGVKETDEKWTIEYLEVEVTGAATADR